MQQAPQEPESFFNKLEKLLSEKGDPSDYKRFRDIGSMDLVSKMAEFHESSAKGNMQIIHADEIREEMKSKLDELKDLEKSWKEKKETINKAMQESYLIEDKINEKTIELKYLIREMTIKPKLLKKLSPKEYFYVHDGKIIKSFEELKYVLEVMSVLAFEYHVNEKKNDFSEWVRYVFDSDELAESIKDCRSKEEMLQALKDI